MSMSDPIADMFTRMRNAQSVKKVEVVMPSSRMKVSIVKVLHDEGYVGDYRVENEKGKAQLRITLKYHAGEPVISRLDRASRPGLRMYKSTDEIPMVMNGLGVVIVSTSKGVMSDRSARKLGIGGEILCYVA